jgi:hypothetical protein
VKKMAETNVAVFNTRDEAIAALGKLRREGVPDSSITVMSSEPLHLETNDAKKTRIAGVAIIGGLIGTAIAVLLTVWTSRRVDLVTGGMPIVSPWAFGIIVFELTALGAILATLGRMIFEAGLVKRRGPTNYDDAVADGKIVVLIASGNETTDEHR